jgi:hypothetical protein
MAQSGHPETSVFVRFRGKSGHGASNGVSAAILRSITCHSAKHRPERCQSLIRHNSEQVTTIPVARCRTAAWPFGDSSRVYVGIDHGGQM